MREHELYLFFASLGLTDRTLRLDSVMLCADPVSKNDATRVDFEDTDNL